LLHKIQSTLFRPSILDVASFWAFLFYAKSEPLLLTTYSRDALQWTAIQWTISRIRASTEKAIEWTFFHAQKKFCIYMEKFPKIYKSFLKIDKNSSKINKNLPKINRICQKLTKIRQNQRKFVENHLKFGTVIQAHPKIFQFYAGF
jgi:hypothetical protein